MQTRRAPWVPSLVLYWHAGRLRVSVKPIIFSIVGAWNISLAAPERNTDIWTGQDPCLHSGSTAVKTGVQTASKGQIAPEGGEGWRQIHRLSAHSSNKARWTCLTPPPHICLNTQTLRSIVILTPTSCPATTEQYWWCLFRLPHHHHHHRHYHRHHHHHLHHSHDHSVRHVTLWCSGGLINTVYLPSPEHLCASTSRLTPQNHLSVRHSGCVCLCVCVSVWLCVCLSACLFAGSLCFWGNLPDGF